MAVHSLMFGWEYPPNHSGGLGVACQGLVRGLLKNGVRVTLVLPHAFAEEEEGLEVRFPTQEMLTTVQVPSLLDPYDNFLTYAERIRSEKSPASMDQLYGPDLGQAVEQFTRLSVELTEDLTPDVVHAHDWMTFEAGIRASRYHAKPLVAHIHATELDRTDFHPNEWIAKRERSGLLACDKVIAVSKYTKNMLVTHYGIPADKIDVVHNGHDHRVTDTVPLILSQRGKKHRPLVLFLGRLTVQKNPWQFLEVANIVHRNRPDVLFAMAGDGPMLGSLIDRSCELQLQDNVVFTGKVSRAETHRLYASADCFVMPSLSEPFGLVALEAIAHHTPVIVSKQSGVSEVLDHAFKVDYWDGAKMADCILTILREEPLAQQLRAEGPSILRRLTWENQAQKITSVYDSVIHTT